MTRVLVLLVALAALAVFVMINWPAFTALTDINVGFSTVQAPLGLIMLGLLVFVCLLFTVWAIGMQATVLMETRRHTKELTAQRELADKAEASRFNDLRAYLEAELTRLREKPDGHNGLMAHMDRLHNETRLMLEENTNSLAANIGELEDRLERQHGLPPAAGRDLLG